jgi:hypothetical protein
MILPTLLLLAACGGDPAAEDAPDGAPAAAQPLAPPPEPEPVLPPPPDLPNEAWLQVFDREGRIVHRLMNDGRYLMQRGDAAPHALAPLSRIEPGMKAISPEARGRIEAAMAQVAFFSQPETVLTSGADLETATPAAYPRQLAITARNPRDNHVHTVLIEADLDEATSFGPLGPMWKALQDDVLGGWTVEPNR